MDILVIRFSSMGDVILTASALSYIKHLQPTASVTLCTSTLYAQLYQNDPRISTIVFFDKRNPDSARDQLKSNSWDYIIDLQNNRHSVRLCNDLSSIHPPAHLSKNHAKRWLLLLTRTNRFLPSDHVIDRYCAVVDKALGTSKPISIDTPEISLPLVESKEFSQQYNSLFSCPCLTLIPFASYQNKEWPIDNFADVGRHFSQKGWNIIILSDADRTHPAERLKQLIGDHTFVFNVSLMECGMLLRHSKLVLGLDTGLSHLARSQGTPTGVVYGSTTWHWGFFPRNKPFYKIFQADILCRPCHAHGGNFCWRFSRVCLKKVRVQDVVSGLEELSTIAGTVHGPSLQ